MLANRLHKAWRARRASTVVGSIMRFSHEGLVVGAETVLAPAVGSSRDVFVDPSDLRLQALLTAAHLGRPSATALSHLRRAADCHRAGDDAFAAMHLALSGLDRLAEP